MQLTPCQQNAADVFVDFLYNDEKYLVIEGFSGVGKTALLDHLIELVDQHKQLASLVNMKELDDIFLTASTNQAARVLTKRTKMDTRTIYSALGLKPYKDFKTGKIRLSRKNAENIERKLVFIDEVSYLGQYPLDTINDCTPGCKVVLIGDGYQLADVETGKTPAFDLPNKVKLLHPVRFSAGSGKDILGKAYRDVIDGTGNFPELHKLNFPDIIHLDGAKFQAKVDEIFNTTWTAGRSRILAWTNGKVKEYNDYIREKITGNNDFYVGELVSTPSPLLTFTGNKKCTISTDTQMVIQDVGKVITVEGFAVRKIKAKVIFDGKMVGGEITVDQPLKRSEVDYAIREARKNKDWSRKFMLEEQFSDLRPIYASTVHKSQGSTYDDVFINLEDIGKCGYSDTVARLLYVAITRAKGNVYLYGRLPAKYGG